MDLEIRDHFPESCLEDVQFLPLNNESEINRKNLSLLTFSLILGHAVGLNTLE